MRSSNPSLRAFLPVLSSLSSEHTPQWGRMTPQHMIEHLIDSLRYSRGLHESVPLADERRIAVNRRFLFSDRPFPRNVEHPFASVPTALQHCSLENAQVQLAGEIDAFYDHFTAQPHAAFPHAYFGILNFDEWEHFHRRHFLHHCEQFGLMASQPEEPAAAAHSAYYRSPVGMLKITGDTQGISSILFTDETGHTTVPACLEACVQQIDEYFGGKRQEFSLPLNLQGTSFQQRVWSALRNIPFGTTTSYGAIAVALGSIDAVRAVGAANGRNPLAIVVPCHRVIGADGTLTGYAGGLWRKQWLLEFEQAGVQPSLFSTR